MATVYDLTPLHDPDVWRSMWPDQRLGWRRAVARIRRAAAVVTISRTVADDVAATLGVETSRIHIVYPSITLEPGEVKPIPRETDHLLFVGALDPHKNLDLLLRALSGLALADRPRLTVVGPWSKAAGEQLTATSARLGLTGVRLEPDVTTERLLALYRCVTALVVPSRREGFGLPVLEAMAHGCPVVAADLPVLREVAGEAAAFVAPNDEEALRDTIQRVLADEGARSRLARAGSRRARAFRPERSWDALAACYRSVGFGTAA